MFYIYASWREYLCSIRDIVHSMNRRNIIEFANTRILYNQTISSAGVYITLNNIYSRDSRGSGYMALFTPIRHPPLTFEIVDVEHDNKTYSPHLPAFPHWTYLNIHDYCVEQLYWPWREIKSEWTHSHAHVVKWVWSIFSKTIISSTYTYLTNHPQTERRSHVNTEAPVWWFIDIWRCVASSPRSRMSSRTVEQSMGHR
jgi:hypothetical protein